MIFGGTEYPQGPQLNDVWVLTNANGLAAPGMDSIDPHRRAACRTHSICIVRFRRKPDESFMPESREDPPKHRPQLVQRCLGSYQCQWIRGAAGMEQHHPNGKLANRPDTGPPPGIRAASAP